MMGSVGGLSGSQAMLDMQAMRTQTFKRSDQDSSGGLSLDEFNAMIEETPDGRPPPGVEDAEAFFTSADVDGDGSLTQDELDAAFDEQMKSMPSTMQMFGGGMPMPPPPPSDSDSESEGDSTQSAGSASGLENRAQMLKQLLERLQSWTEENAAGLSLQA